MKEIFILITILGYSEIIFPQNVGIGTTTPLEKLSVVSNFGYGISHEANAIKLSSYIDAGGAYIGTMSNHPFHLYTNNGAAQVSLGTNGYLGLGNISPQYRLDMTGRMRIRTGAVGNIFTTSGIWMDDYRDGSPRIFFGMQDSIRLGIWGDGTPGVGWGLNFNARNGNVGIGVADPAARLDVNGTFKLTDGTQAAGKVLVTDSAGNACWNGAIGFAATKTSIPLDIGLFANADIVCNTEEYDQAPASAYDPSTGYYTVPQNGLYHFDAGAVVVPTAANQQIVIEVKKNTAYLREASSSSTNASNFVILNLSFDAQLTKGDVIKFSIFNRSSYTITLKDGIFVYNKGTFFNGHLIR